MDSLLIRGGVPLHGEVTVSGSKNAALPIMAATLLTAEPCVIHRVPDLSDVRFMGQILASLGATVRFEGDTLNIRAQKITNLLKQQDPNFKGIPVSGISGGTGNNIGTFSVGHAPYTYLVYKQIYDAATGKLLRSVAHVGTTPTLMVTP